MITFEVLGTPQPQGSMNAFIPKGWSRPVLTSSNKKMRKWRDSISIVCKEAAKTAGSTFSLPFPLGRPVHVSMVFSFRRPKSTKKGVWKPTKPDLDKLARCVCDAMTRILYEDDSQIASLNAQKIFNSREGVYIKVMPKW